MRLLGPLSLLWASLLKLLSGGSVGGGGGEDGVSAIQQCSRQVLAAVALVLIARLGLKALPKLGDSDEVSRNRVDLKALKALDSPESHESVTGKALVRGSAGKANKLVEEEDEEAEEEEEEDRECSCLEDEVFDVLALRKMVKIERRRAIAATKELEKERIAAASAADEAMSLILRLQSEKSAIEMTANQDRRLAEQKQQYDWEVIESLRRMVASQESRRRALEERLRSCRRRLRRTRASSEGSSGVEGEGCFGGGGGGGSASEESVGGAVTSSGEEEEEEEGKSLDDVLRSSLELDSLIEE
ncbi:probable myosin-binding protein 5 [Eucalyptus grandis]|uniref:probable myosin-binding protein 5 n=1 Tax=Eucalyptus grandis TaxID=71139 RepID=UPI00192E80CF|nr:probable myosin-binding protein 5 [Eucalyptus grandis]